MGIKESKGNTAGSHQRHNYYYKDVSGHESQELLLEEEDTPLHPFKINMKVADKTNGDNSSIALQNEALSGHNSPFVL